MKLFSNFLLLPLWLRRLLIAGMLWPTLVAVDHHKPYEAMAVYSGTYWGVILVGCWIYEGFVQKK